MSISKKERKALEILSFGGRIVVEKDDKKRVVTVDLINREGWFLDGFGADEFDKLLKKKLVASSSGKPYIITKKGLSALSISRNTSKAK